MKKAKCKGVSAASLLWCKKKWKIRKCAFMGNFFVFLGRNTGRVNQKVTRLVTIGNVLEQGGEKVG